MVLQCICGAALLSSSCPRQAQPLEKLQIKIVGNKLCVGSFHVGSRQICYLICFHLLDNSSASSEQCERGALIYHYRKHKQTLVCATILQMCVCVFVSVQCMHCVIEADIHILKMVTMTILFLVDRFSIHYILMLMHHHSPCIHIWMSYSARISRKLWMCTYI